MISQAMTSTLDIAPRPVVASAEWSCSTSFGKAWVVDAAEKIDPGLWRSALTQDVRDGRFYQITELTLADQFDQRYFILKNDEENLTAIQPFFFVKQDLTVGLPRALRDQVLWLRRRWPNLLFFRILMVGCPAGEGRLDRAESWVTVSLREALDAYERVTKPAVVLLKDFPAEYRQIFAEFTDHGFRRMAGMPAAKLDLNFGSFEEYMQQKLGKAFRKNLRRKFKVLKTVAPLTMEVLTDVAPVIDEIFPLHLQVFQRARMRFEVLNKEYFLALSQNMPDKARFFVWRQEGRIIAFNLCLIHNRVLYDLDVGFDYAVALELHLYFVTWRDIIQWCVENGIKTYHAGPLNYDPKLHLKLKLVPQDLYARMTALWLNRPLQLVMSYLEPVRYEPLLRQFANAHEL